MCRRASSVSISGGSIWRTRACPNRSRVDPHPVIQVSGQKRVGAAGSLSEREAALWERYTAQGAGTENQTWLIIAALPAETKFPMIGWFGYGGRSFRQDSVFQPAAKRLRMVGFEAIAFCVVAWYV
jgi:hypothetical protein